MLYPEAEEEACRVHLALFHSENPTIYYAEIYVGRPSDYKKLTSGPVGSTVAEAFALLLDQMAAELEVKKRLNSTRDVMEGKEAEMTREVQTARESKAPLEAREYVVPSKGGEDEG